MDNVRDLIIKAASKFSRKQDFNRPPMQRKLQLRDRRQGCLHSIPAMKSKHVLSRGQVAPHVVDVVHQSNHAQNSELVLCKSFLEVIDIKRREELTALVAVEDRMQAQ
jgi:hypothetical protein